MCVSNSSRCGLTSSQDERDRAVMGKPGQGDFVPVELCRPAPKESDLFSKISRTLCLPQSNKSVQNYMHKLCQAERRKKAEDQLLAGEMVGALSLDQTQSPATTKSYNHAMAIAREVDVFL